MLDQRTNASHKQIDVVWLLFVPRDHDTWHITGLNKTIWGIDWPSSNELHPYFRKESVSDSGSIEEVRCDRVSFLKSYNGFIELVIEQLIYIIQHQIAVDILSSHRQRKVEASGPLLHDLDWDRLIDLPLDHLEAGFEFESTLLDGKSNFERTSLEGLFWAWYEVCVVVKPVKVSKMVKDYSGVTKTNQTPARTTQNRSHNPADAIHPTTNRLPIVVPPPKLTHPRAQKRRIQSDLRAQCLWGRTATCLSLDGDTVSRKDGVLAWQ